MLVVERERVALELDAAVRAAHLELVVRPLLHAGQEDFPDAAAEQLAHRVHAAVPAVEIADDADPPGVGRPDGEGAAAHAADLLEVRAELVVEAVVIALGEEVQVEFAQDRPEGIRVGLDGLVAGGVREAQAVVGPVGRALGQHGLEEPRVVRPCRPAPGRVAGLRASTRATSPRVRREDPHHPVVVRPGAARGRQTGRRGWR